MCAVRVYLDSSDYSDLSKTHGLSDEQSSVLAQLRNWVREGRIACYYSGTHLHEMAPVKAQYADAANLRADLLSELCGRNALISMDRVFAGELQYCLGVADSLPVVHTGDGDWYPEGFSVMSPVTQLGRVAGIENTIQEVAGNRKQRRMATQKALKNGRPRPSFQAAAIANARNGALEEILDVFPMRLQDARVLSRYVVGDASAEDATRAYEASLRDPNWMMQWFEKHHDGLSPFIEWVRSPAAMLQRSLDNLARLSAAVRQDDLDYGTRNADALFSSKSWKSSQDGLVQSTATAIAQKLQNDDGVELKVEAIDRLCPGFSVCIRSLHSSWRTVTGLTPRPTKLSDFPDALHAVYAPYVDIFRADSFMADHISKHAERFGTTVVSKLVLLPDAISKALAAAEGNAYPKSARS
jgi:hypothetical protein